MQSARLLILSVLGIGATVAAIDGLARLFVSPPAARFLAEFATDRAFVEPDPELGFTLVPGYAGSGYRINDAGYRGPDFPADVRERFTVLCAGDSTTFGWLVGEGEDFPARLSRLLQARHPTALAINAGVPSYTSAQILGKLGHDLERVDPEVVVVTMPWNDMWYSSFAPWNAGILVPRLPAPWQMWLLRHSGLFRAVASPRVPEPTADRTAPEALDVFANNLKQTVDLARRSGAAVVFQTPPFDFDHVKPGGVRFAPTGLEWGRDFLLQVARRYVDRFRSIAAAEGVALVENPLSIDRPHQRERFVDEIHPAGDAYGLVAAALLRALDSERLLPAAYRSDDGG
jgi:lysophospholipase L1-like esterase